MCGLCSLDPVKRKHAADSALRLADDLRRLANYECSMAYGEIKPHGDETKAAGVLARSIVRRLVNDYV